MFTRSNTIQTPERGNDTWNFNFFTLIKQVQLVTQKLEVVEDIHSVNT